MPYPFVDPELLASLSVLPIEARQAMLGNITGRHRSLNHGSSAEFSEYRKYVQGDDIRMLDWKAYARSDRYYIKQSEADTNLLAHCLVDTSGSMAFQGASKSKIELIRELVATLCALAIRQGDAAGLNAISSDIDIQIPPRRKPSHLHQIYQSLDSLKPSGKTGLCEGIHSLAEDLPRRGLVLIFSDFFCELDELKDALLHLKHRKHDVVLFHILDSMEIDFDFSQAYRFVDLEDGGQVNVDSDEIRNEYQALMGNYLAEIQEVAASADVEYRRTLTSDSSKDILTRFLNDRLMHFQDA